MTSRRRPCAARASGDPVARGLRARQHSPSGRRTGRRTPPGRCSEPEPGGDSHRSHQQDAAAIPPALITSALALIAGLGLFAPAGTCAEEAVEAPLAIESLLLDGAAAGSRLVVVGERGHILVSTDGGASWKQARVPTRALLTAVHLHDERTGWAVGHDAVILRTGDGGATWEMVHHAPGRGAPSARRLVPRRAQRHRGGSLRLLPRHRGRRRHLERARGQRGRLPLERAGARGGRAALHRGGGGRRVPLRRRRRDLARAGFSPTPGRGSAGSRSARRGCCCSGSGATCFAPRTRAEAGPAYPPGPTRP